MKTKWKIRMLFLKSDQYSALESEYTIIGIFLRLGLGLEWDFVAVHHFIIFLRLLLLTMFWMWIRNGWRNHTILVYSKS